MDVPQDDKTDKNYGLIMLPTVSQKILLTYSLEKYTKNSIPICRSHDSLETILCSLLQIATLG